MAQTQTTEANISTQATEGNISTQTTEENKSTQTTEENKSNDSVIFKAWSAVIRYSTSLVKLSTNLRSLKMWYNSSKRKFRVIAGQATTLGEVNVGLMGKGVSHAQQFQHDAQRVKESLAIVEKTCQGIVTGCKDINVKANTNREENAGLSNYWVAGLFFVAVLSVAVVLGCFNVAMNRGPSGTAVSRSYSEAGNSPGENTGVLASRAGNSEVGNQYSSIDQGGVIITMGKGNLIAAILINGAIVVVVIMGLCSLYRYCSNKHNFDNLGEESTGLSTNTNSLLEKIGEINFYLESIINYVERIDKNHNDLLDTEAQYLENLAKGLNKDANEMLINFF